MRRRSAQLQPSRLAEDGNLYLSLPISIYLYPSLSIADDEDSRGAAFSSDIDPATLGPPPEWGTTTPFMPPLAAAPPEPTPPEDAATEPEPEPAPVAEAKADGAKAGGAKDELD